MQIKMIGTFSYDLVPGVSRRTLHAGLVLDEPVDVAQEAIDAGKAMRWPPAAEMPTEAEPSEAPAVEPVPAALGAKVSGKKAGGKKADSEPAAAPAPAPTGEPTPAEAVEPGGDDDATDA